MLQKKYCLRSCFLEQLNLKSLLSTHLRQQFGVQPITPERKNK